MILLATLLATTQANAADVLVISTIDSYGLDVVAQLNSTGMFGVVDMWQGGGSTPSMPTLLNYDVVMLEFDGSYADPNALGNVLADYVDLGGGVVTSSFDHAFPGLTGRFAAGYHAILPGSPYNSTDDRLANLTLWGSPYRSGFFNDATAQAAPTAVGQAWYDDGGLLAASHRPSGAGIVVAVNDYNVSNDVGRTDFWDTGPGYAGAEVWAGAALYAAGEGLSTFATGTCGGPSVIETFGATPNGKVGYVSGRLGGLSAVPAGPCAGTMLPLNNLKLRKTRSADGAGQDTISLASYSSGVCGADFVVLDLTTCSYAVGKLP